MRAVLVGTGAIARQHLACLATLSDVEVAGVCDLSAATARATAERFAIPRWSTDYDGLLAETRPDIVHVTTPPRSHYRLAAGALEAGAHVIVEKPATATPDELVALVDLARDRRRVLIEDYNYVFSRGVQRVLALVDSGAFGEVVHVEAEISLDILGSSSPYLDPGRPADVVDMPGGAIADFLPHLASLAYAFAGPHREVATIWRRRGPAGRLPADEFRALVDGERATAVLSFSAHSRPDEFWVRVSGTKMRATINLFEPRATFERLLSLPRPLLPLVNGAAEAWGVAGAAVGGLVRKLSGGPGAYEGLWSLLSRTYASVREGMSPPVSLEQILHVNQLVAELVNPARQR